MSKFHLKSSLSWTIFSFFFISQSHITTSSNGDLEGLGESLTLKSVGPHEQKLTRIQLYDHNIRTGIPTSFVIVPAANTTGIPSHSDFGAVTVVDDPLTFGLELSTTQVGRLQGIMASVDKNEISLFSAFNIEFTGGKYNGSTISIYGRNNAAEPVREFPIIGGSGHFRFATGYAELRTASVSNSEIPEELWNGDGFSRIASAIGEPLYADRKTEQKTKTDYARICIDVKATSTFPTTIPVVVDKKKVFKVTAEYNWRPPRCMHCKVFGHSENNCSRVHKEKKQRVWAQKETAVEESAKVIETRIVSEIIEIVEDAQKQHLEVMEEDVHEQESNGEITTSVITPPSPHIAENTDQEEGEITNQKESDLEDVVVTSITPMTTSIAGGATIQVANGFRFLDDDEEIPESMKNIMEQVDLVNSRMSAFLDKNKGGSSQQSPIVDRIKQKTGGGRGRQKGASSSKTVSDATDESSLGIRKSQREPIAPVRLNFWLFGSASVLTEEMVAKQETGTIGNQSLKLNQSQKPTSTSAIVVPYFLTGSSLSRL